MEGVLTSSAGEHGQSEAGLGRSDLFRSLGLTRVIGDKDDEEVGTASKDMPANCRGSLLFPAGASPPRGEEKNAGDPSYCTSHICSARFILAQPRF